jgi:hypothetical protein
MTVLERTGHHNNAADLAVYTFSENALDKKIASGLTPCVLIFNDCSASCSRFGLYFLSEKRSSPMSLLLPVLLLGLAQAADQPANASSNQAQNQPNAPSAFVNPPRFTQAGPKLGGDPNTSNRRQNFDQIEVPPNPEAGPPVCLTMRSYFFERKDDLAPEFVGMTTCDSGRRLAQRRVNRSNARLVPAR